MPRGVVKFYNIRGRFGVVSPEDQSGDLKVHQSALTGAGLPLLAKGDEVEYEAVGEHDGRLTALGVRRLAQRQCGVLEFDRDLGWGWIAPEDGSKRVWVHYSEFLVEEGLRANPEDGERVEYEVGQRKWRTCAVRVLRLDTRSPLERWAVLASFDRHLTCLAEELAEREDWGLEKKTGKPFPVLRSYVQHTFARLQAEGGKIAEVRDERGRPLACWNTGLVTPLQEEIFAYFEEAIPPREDDPNAVFMPAPRWVLRGFVEESDRRLSSFASRPASANYFTEPAELLYDSRRKLVTDWKHLLERRRRFPDRLQAMPDAEFREVVGQKIAAAERRAARNYKTAVPQFHRGTLQLLLPLCLTRADRADLALVVSRDGETYRAWTVLPLDWAVKNARLLTRPDREWLAPMASETGSEVTVALRAQPDGTEAETTA